MNRGNAPQRLTAEGWVFSGRDWTRDVEVADDPAISALSCTIEVHPQRVSGRYRWVVEVVSRPPKRLPTDVFPASTTEVRARAVVGWAGQLAQARNRVRHFARALLCHHTPSFSVIYELIARGGVELAPWAAGMIQWRLLHQTTATSMEGVLITEELRRQGRYARPRSPFDPPFAIGADDQALTIPSTQGEPQ